MDATIDPGRKALVDVRVLASVVGIEHSVIGIEEVDWGDVGVVSGAVMGVVTGADTIFVHDGAVSDIIGVVAVDGPASELVGISECEVLAPGVEATCSIATSLISMASDAAPKLLRLLTAAAGRQSGILTDLLLSCLIP